MKQWKDMTGWEKFGSISLLFYYLVGLYTVMYNVAIWSYQIADWICEKKIELEGYFAGRKAAKKSNEEV